MSHVATCRLITKLGDGHDGMVKEWRDQFSLLLEKNHEVFTGVSV